MAQLASSCTVPAGARKSPNNAMVRFAACIPVTCTLVPEEWCCDGVTLGFCLSSVVLCWLINTDVFTLMLYDTVRIKSILMIPLSVWTS